LLTSRLLFSRLVGSLYSSNRLDTIFVNLGPIRHMMTMFPSPRTHGTSLDHRRITVERKTTVRIIFPTRSMFFALLLLAVSAASYAQVSIGISVGFPPPALPVYEQPLCPGEGYIWTPGYWAWDGEDEDYYWVPGTWVVAPQVGYLWTPGWWGWNEGYYAFHEGYWGPFVGFYGGVSYGYGYFGRGYEGGRWDHDRFYYNTTVNNVNVTEIHNTYNTTIINNNTTINRVSYSGGNGGTSARPSREEEQYARERHVPPVAAQTRHVQEARGDRELRASVNHGKPAIAATPRPGEFKDRAAVAAREAGGRYEPPANRGRGANASRSNTGIHPNDRPPHQQLPAPNTGDPRLDQKYRQQQDKLYAKQDQEHQKLQQKQEQEHQRLVQQNANDARRQQMEQRHQQQTQQLEQRHEQQRERVQQRQQPPPRPSQSRPNHP